MRATMDAIIAFCCIITVLLQSMTSVNMYRTNSHGWIPISASEVYYPQLRYMKDSEYFQKHTSENHTTDYSNKEFDGTQRNILKVLGPEFIKKVNSTLTTNKIESDEGNIIRYETDQDLTNSTEMAGKHIQEDVDFNKTSNKNTTLSENQIRKAKKMVHGYDYKINNYNKTKGDEPTQQTLIKEDETRNAYEVKENANDFDTISTNILNQQGYIYKSQLNDRKTNSFSLTNRLQNILSKYNINANDNLQNYALSLSDRPEITRNNYVLVPMSRIEFPHKYNSLNHLPINPLLAVFLSNYGYYLQGQYGIQNKYRNLYGYLASNNIHNNNPFGAYKIFSDTDSSN